MTTAMLSLDRVAKAFGGVRAVDDLSLHVAPQAIHGLIGPNGAGKTTVFNLITGVFPPSRGRVLLDGRDITHLAPHQIARHGVARTFQNIRLFKSMTVLEHVLLGQTLQERRGMRLWWPSSRQIASVGAEAERILRLTGLWEARNLAAATLPYGDQRRAEIARALATGPKLLLLDEPAAGMNPTETAGLKSLVRSLRQEGLTVLLIEHDMPFVMELCDRITVLNFGEKIAEGTPEEVKRDPAVLDAYLGAEDGNAFAVG